MANDETSTGGSFYSELWHEFAIRTINEHPYHQTTAPGGCPRCSDDEVSTRVTNT